MIRNSVALFLVAMTGLLLAACQANNTLVQSALTAPIVWIDSPLDGAVFPYVDNTDPASFEQALVIHAASDIGIESIDMRLEEMSNGEIIDVRIGTFHSPDGGGGGGSSDDNEDVFEWSSSGLAIVQHPQDFDLDIFLKDEVVAQGGGYFKVHVWALAPGGKKGPETVITIYICNTDVVLGPPPSCLPIADVSDGTASSTQGFANLVAIPNRNANCRLGPSSTYFDIADTLFMGTEYMPIAQGPDMMWLLFSGPATQTRCWAFIDNLDLFCGDMSVEIANIPPCSLPFADYPPTPTPTPTPEPSATPTPRPPQCSDGIDNDGDGSIDMADGRCLSPSDDSESS